MPSRMSVGEPARAADRSAPAGRAGRTAAPRPDRANETASMARVGPGPIVGGEQAGDGRADDEADRVDAPRRTSSPGRPASARRGPAPTRCSPRGRTSEGCSSARPRCRMTTIVGPPRNTEIGIRAVRTARPRSARNIIRLRSLRSARAPATIPKNRSGRVWSAPTTPIAKPGAGQGQDEQRQRREADRVAERRDALRPEQDLEVAVLAERGCRRPAGRRGGRAYRGRLGWSPARWYEAARRPVRCRDEIEASAADAIVAAGRRLGARGLISAGEGNLSVRLDDVAAAGHARGPAQGRARAGRPRGRSRWTIPSARHRSAIRVSRRRRTWRSTSRSTRPARTSGRSSTPTCRRRWR